MSLESTDVFAVQNPDSDEMVFVQVSGGIHGTQDSLRRPGFQPNHPSVEDLRFLSHVIRQTYEVVQKIKEGTLSLEVAEGQEDDYFLRKPVLANLTEVKRTFDEAISFF